MRTWDESYGAAQRHGVALQIVSNLPQVQDPQPFGSVIEEGALALDDTLDDAQQGVLAPPNAVDQKRRCDLRKFERG